MKSSAQRAVASVVSIALAFSPALACAREAVVLRTTGAAIKAPLLSPAILPSLATALPRIPNRALGAIANAPVAPVAASAQAAAAASFASRLAADAPASAAKAQSGAAFDASLSGPAFSAEPAVPAAASAAAPAGAALSSFSPKASTGKAIPSPRVQRWKQAARKHLPAAAAVAVAAGIAIIAQMTGHAQAGLAALPLLAGALNPTGPLSKRESFRAALLSSSVPGQAVTMGRITALAVDVQLPLERVMKVLDEEVENGNLVRFSNGFFIRVDMDAEAQDGKAQAAVKIARAALAQRDLPMTEALAALGRIAAARDLAIQSESSRADSLERQLGVLRLNFAYDMLRRLAAESGLNPKASEHVMGLTHDLIDKTELAPASAAAGLAMLLRALPETATREAAEGSAYLKFVVESMVPDAAPAPMNLASARSTMDEVRAALKHYMAPGFEITAAIKSRIAAELNLEPAVVEASLRTLAANNLLARVGERALVYTSVSDYLRLAPADPDSLERRAVLAAMAGVRHLNGASLLEYALAERSFVESMTLLEQGKWAEPWGDLAGEILLLRRNAMIKIMGDLVLKYERGAEGQLDTEAWQNVNGWNRWLANGFVAHDREQPVLEKGRRGWLLDLIDSLKPSLKSQRAVSHGEAIAAALKDTGEYLATLKAAEDIKLLPTGGPNIAGKGFPLIEKNEKGYTALNQYAANVTASAAAGKLDPVVGRDEELELMYEVLLGRKKNNPLLYGEPGVGKTAIIEKLAQQLIKGEVPERLKGKNIFSLDLNALIAGTTLRGEFEARLQKVLDEVSNSNGRVILFIDEIHMVLGLGSSEGSQDMANVLKRRMDRGGFSVVGATTLDEYRKVEKDKALDRRFGGVFVRPATVPETAEILESQRPLLEKLHKVKITDGAVAAAPKLAKQFITDRRLPDSAIDLLDAAAAQAELKGQAEVSADDVARMLARRKGLPLANLSEDQTEALRSMPQEFKKRVIGQDEAVDAVVEAEQMSRQGLKDPNQPDAFIFVGPTGSGKTEVARVLAKFKYGDEGAVVKIDGSDYMEKFNVTRLNGAPPGYVGHESGGQLTEPIRRRPNQVVLFDEIDKMHVDALNLLLQILEDGEIKDSEGRVVDFRNTTIIFTANFLGEHSADEKTETAPIGFGTPGAPRAHDELAATQSALKAKYLADIKKKLRPEFLNRVGDERIIVFNELSKENLGVIIDLRMADLNRRFADRGQAIALTARGKAHIVDSTWETARRYGARPIKQAVNRLVVLALSKALLEGRVSKTDAVVVDYDAARGGWIADKAPASAN